MYLEPTEISMMDNFCPNSQLLKDVHYPPQKKKKTTENSSQLQSQSQLTITCSKLTIETLEQGVKYVQS